MVSGSFFVPHIFVWGFCFWLCTRCLLPSFLRLRRFLRRTTHLNSHTTHLSHNSSHTTHHHNSSHISHHLTYVTDTPHLKLHLTLISYKSSLTRARHMAWDSLGTVLRSTLSHGATFAWQARNTLTLWGLLGRAWSPLGPGCFGVAGATLCAWSFFCVTGAALCASGASFARQVRHLALLALLRTYPSILISHN